MRDWLSTWNEFPYFDGHRYESKPCSFLIKNFTTQSKIYFGYKGYFKLKYNGRTS